MEQRKCHLDLWNALEYIKHRPEAIWGCEWLDAECIPEDWNLNQQSWKQIVTEDHLGDRFLWIVENDGGPGPNKAFDKLKCSYEYTCNLLNYEGHIDTRENGNPYRVKLILV